MESSKNLAVFCLGLPFTSVVPFFSINGIVPVEDEEPRLYKSFSCFQIIKMYLTLEETVRGGIQPAFVELKKRGFTNLKLLNMPVNLKTNWISHGYPLSGR